MDKDLISVIMPVYNAERYLPMSVPSILSQSYKYFELIIVDDRSTDSSYNRVINYKNSDTRVKLFRNRFHRGVGYSFNYGIKKAKGQYIARMDADDVMRRDRLKKQVDFMKRNQDLVCLGSWMIEINEKNKTIGKRRTPINHKKIYEKMFYEMAIQNPTLMINRRVIPKHFSWCKTDGILDDLDLLFKLMQFGNFGNIGDYLMLYRIHKDNLSLKNIKETFKEALKIRKMAISKYGYIPTVRGRIISLIQQLFVNFIPNKYLYNFYKISKKFNF